MITKLRMMKSIGLLTVLIMVMGMLTACGKSEGLNEATVIRIGYQTNNVYKVVDDEKQWLEDEFEKDGIEVEWVEFVSGPPLIEALAAGSIDIGTQLGDTPFINALANNVAIQGIAVSPYDPKAFAIVLSSQSAEEIHTIQDLKGKKVAVTAGTAGQDFFLKELEAAGLSEDDVEMVNISTAAAMLSALVAREVDAINALEPNASNYVIENDCVLLDYGISQKQFLNLAVANTDFAEKNPELVARYVKIALEIDDYVQENTEDVKETISKLTELPVEALTNYDRFEYKDQFDDESLATLEETVEFMISAGLLENEVDFTNAFTNDYLDEAKRLLEEESK